MNDVGMMTTILACHLVLSMKTLRVEGLLSPRLLPIAAMTACIASLYAVCMQRPLWRAQHRDAICSTFCVFWLVSLFMVMYRRSMSLEVFGDRIQLTHHTQSGLAFIIMMSTLFRHVRFPFAAAAILMKKPAGRSRDLFTLRHSLVLVLALIVSVIGADAGSHIMCAYAQRAGAGQAVVWTLYASWNAVFAPFVFFNFVH
ncbi:hypothetical protein QBZ16_001695 [Prototheca wickerhamii]|uniref:Uncharacterized protein n=1 Tax=Prototheca wickerhamii TaxID=3111 RepID=A0AAD9MGN2_PROWI|nr:hypothetical protein QBZ16_001695 [Prototheca wickerhamii]